MTVPLSKGNNINLTKTNPNLKNIVAGLGWDVRETDGETFDLDASILMVKADGKVRSDSDFIYYHQKDSACGAIHHTGDNRTGAGDGDDEAIGSPYKSMQVDFYQRVTGIGITNKYLQVNAS